MGCEKQETETLKNADLIIGTWINPIYLDSTFTLKSSKAIDVENYGITFNANNTLTEHKNSGWCGTPPVSYAEFEGNWELSDSILSISVAYWGGMANYKWKIISINDSTIEIYSIQEDYHMEERD